MYLQYFSNTARDQRFFNMKERTIHGMYFSPTGNGRKVNDFLCYELSSAFEKQGIGVQVKHVSLNKEDNRAVEYTFGEDDILVINMPTYAGRVPNVLKDFLATCFRGNGALCIPVVTYGNRSYENSLLELATLMKKDGFRVIAGAAFVGQHPFSEKLGRGRPDMEDVHTISRFGEEIAGRIITNNLEEFVPEGDYETIKYYTPLGIDGQPAKFLKACPVQDDNRCNDCGRCYLICPVASKNICIKCMACVTYCHAFALKFENEAFLSHVAYLEANYADELGNRKEPDMFIGSSRFI